MPAPASPRPPEEIGLPNFLAVSKPRTRNTGWIWALLVVIALAAGGTAAFLKWGRQWIVKPADLGLETYDINGAFLIRWDRESNVVRTATHATIEIQDGADKTPIELSRGELAVGGYGYVRRTGQVSVHMKVEGEIPADEYSNFNSSQSLGSQPAAAPAAANESQSGLEKALAEKEHLKTELINESMQSLELRQQVADLTRQLAEERAKK
jgi:hypothetical protein